MARLLSLRLGLFRSLQRVDRRRAGKSTALARRILGYRNHHVPIASTRNRAFDHQQVLFEIDPANPQIAHRYLLCAVVARHSLPREHARRKARGADRTLDLEHMSVRLRTAAEIVAAHNTRKAAALRAPDHVYELRIG